MPPPDYRPGRSRRYDDGVGGVALLVVVLLAGNPGVTDPPSKSAAVSPPDAGDLRAQGLSHLRMGRAEEALPLLLAAYEKSSDPELLFSIARCHAALRSWESAAFSAEEYLRSGTPSDRERAEKLFEEAKEEVARDREMVRLTKLLVGGAEKPAPERNPALPPKSASARRPVHREPWVWGAVGALAAIAAASIIVPATQPRTRRTLPDGDLGTIDRRNP